MPSDKVKLLIHTAEHHETPSQIATARKSRRFASSRKLSFQEKLLRNSCFACAILLGILALGNVQQPWASKASGAIEKALTMEIDLDKSLGQLTFVQKLMPESALVFFNLNSENALLQPIQGNIVHPYSEAQPWLMFQTQQTASVCAAADGVVSAISPMADGAYGILIDHGNGLESVTACLNEIEVQSGSSVVRGGIIGSTDEYAYFELREGGESIDPTERMGL